MTTEEAWELLAEHYPAATIDEDPGWATEMVDALVAGDITLPWPDSPSLNGNPIRGSL